MNNINGNKLIKNSQNFYVRWLVKVAQGMFVHVLQTSDR